MFSKRLERDIRIGPVSLDVRGELIDLVLGPGILAETPRGRIDGEVGPAGGRFPATLRHVRKLRGLPLLLSLAVTGATALLPARVEQVAREVEKVRGKRFER